MEQNAAVHFVDVGRAHHRELRFAQVALVDEIELKSEAHRVRSAFEALRAIDEGKLRDFPSQCCDTACRVLGLHLHAIGTKNIREVLARVSADQKHRWLEVGGLVVDITADQFGQAEVVVAADSVHISPAWRAIEAHQGA